MKKIVLSLFILALALSASAVWADGFEIQPFVGATSKSNINLTNASDSKLQFDAGFQWGFTIGGLFGENRNLGIDFHFDSVHTATVVKSTGKGLFDMHNQSYYGDFLYHFGGKDSRIRPYGLVGIGLTHFNPVAANEVVGDLTGATKFGIAVGGGAKAYFSPRLGFRGELRYSFTKLNSNADEIFCVAGDGCFVDGTASNTLNQLAFTGGLIIRM